MDILDDMTVEGIACPHCHHKQSPTIKALKSGRYKCTACGVVFDAKRFRRQIADLESQLKKAGF